MPTLPPIVHWLLTGAVSGLAAAQQMIPMSSLAHAIVAVVLVTFAALGLIPVAQPKQEQ